MKAVGSHLKTALALLWLISLLGCQALEGTKHGNQVSGGLALDASLLDFGKVVVGSSKTLSVKIDNVSTAPITITNASTSGADYSIVSPGFPLTLAPAQATKFSIQFTPHAKGSPNGTIAITSTGTNLATTISLTASAVSQGKLSASPSALSFGTVLLGRTQTKQETILNTGDSDVSISQMTASRSDIQWSGLTLPLTLSAGKSAAFVVKFNPTRTGSATGNIAVSMTASLAVPDQAHLQRHSTPMETAVQVVTIPVDGVGSTAGSILITPAAVNFGSVQVGSSQSHTLTLSNSGGAAVNLAQANLSGNGFSLSGIALPVTIAAGQSVSLVVNFAPQAAGNAVGSLSLINDGANPNLALPLSATAVSAGALTSTPSALNFGTVQMFKSQAIAANLVNSGGSAVTVTQAVVSGSGFSMSGIAFPFSLAAGQSRVLSVSYAPISSGVSSGSLTISSSAANTTLSIPLSATAATAGALNAIPSNLSFGSVQVGQTGSVSATLTNSGGTAVTVNLITASGAGVSLSGTTTPFTIAPGQSKILSAVYAPSATANLNASITVSSDAANSSLIIPVTATAITAGSLSAAAPSLSFGSIQAGSNSSLSETLTNNGGSSITITQATASGAAYSLSGLTLPTTLAPGQSTSFSVGFAPSSAGPTNGNVAVISNASNPPVNISLSGTGVTQGALSIGSATLSYGSVAVGNNQSQSETVTNSGGSSITLSQVNVTGSSFAVTGLTTPLSLAAGQSFTFGVRFTPIASGASNGTISLVATGSVPSLSVVLSGSGSAVGQLSISPSALNLGSVNVGSSQSSVVNLSASGNGVNIAAVSFSSDEFTISGLSLPASIPVGQIKSFTIIFTPKASGAASASATFTSDAANASTVLSLAGTGNAPPQHSVDLSWNPSSASVNGYSVYRGTRTGGPYSKITTSVDPSTTFSDAVVSAGQTYFYVTTAVGTDGSESIYSNEVSASIPTP